MILVASLVSSFSVALLYATAASLRERKRQQSSCKYESTDKFIASFGRDLG